MGTKRVHALLLDFAAGQPANLMVGVSVPEHVVLKAVGSALANIHGLEVPKGTRKYLAGVCT